MLFFNALNILNRSTRSNLNNTIKIFILSMKVTYFFLFLFMLKHANFAITTDMH